MDTPDIMLKLMNQQKPIDLTFVNSFVTKISSTVTEAERPELNGTVTIREKNKQRDFEFAFTDLELDRDKARQRQLVSYFQIKSCKECIFHRDFICLYYDNRTIEDADIRLLASYKGKQCKLKEFKIESIEDDNLRDGRQTR